MKFTDLTDRRFNTSSGEFDEGALVKGLLEGGFGGGIGIRAEIVGKEYELHAFSIRAKGYDRPIQVAIGIPRKKRIDPEVEPPEEGSQKLSAFERELERFRKILPELKKTHLHEFVAVLNGQVVDHDKNEIELAKRIYRSYRGRFVLIREVKEESPVTYYLESPEGIAT